MSVLTLGTLLVFLPLTLGTGAMSVLTLLVFLPLTLGTGGNVGPDARYTAGFLATDGR